MSLDYNDSAISNRLVSRLDMSEPLRTFVSRTFGIISEEDREVNARALDAKIMLARLELSSTTPGKETAKTLLAQAKVDDGNGIQSVHLIEHAIIIQRYVRGHLARDMLTKKIVYFMAN